MTTLSIVPKYESKRLEFDGTVAAGEHVAVSIVGGSEWAGTSSALRLRVLFGGKMVAVFPYWTDENEDDWPDEVVSADAWNTTGEDPTCTLVLNTIQAEKTLRHGGECLWILDDVENHTLYGMGEFFVGPWPKHRPNDVPYNLDGYPDFVEDAKAAIDSVATNLSTHTGNGDIHVNASQKTEWTAKYDKPRGGIPASDLAGGITKMKLASSVQESLSKADTALQPSALTSYVNNASYDSTEKKILLKHGSSTVAYIDATAFINDGMVSNVDVSNGNLVITFNTDAGKTPISIALTRIFNPANYYDKTAADGRYVQKDIGGTAGNFAVLDANGNLMDSGNKAANFATAAQGAKADSALQTHQQLVPVYGDNGEPFTWTVEGLPEGISATPRLYSNSEPPFWYIDFSYDGHEYYGEQTAPLDATFFTFRCEAYGVDTTYTVTATRTPNAILGYTLGTQQPQLGMMDDAKFAPVYSSSATYAVGALCVYGGHLYKCNTAIASGEAWTAAHWTLTDVTTELATKQDKSNLVTALSAQSTDEQYPSAKCVYDNLEAKLDASSVRYDIVIPTYSTEDTGDIVRTYNLSDRAINVINLTVGHEGIWTWEGNIEGNPENGVDSLTGFPAGTQNKQLINYTPGDTTCELLYYEPWGMGTVLDWNSSNGLIEVEMDSNPGVTYYGNFSPGEALAIEGDSSATVLGDTPASLAIGDRLMLYYDRSVNGTQTSTRPNPGELVITPPTPRVNGKVRDFLVLINMNASESIPAVNLSGLYGWYTPNGDAPEIQATTGKTLLMFTEISSDDFLVRSEEIEGVDQ